MTDEEQLTKIVQELREQAEYVSMLIDPPGSQSSRRNESGNWVTRPRSETWELADDATVERLCESAYELAEKADALQTWLDDHGLDELKDPHRGEDRWYGYAPLDGGRRSWWRRLVS